MDLIQLNRCPVCGGSEREYIFSKRGKNSGIMFDLQRCNNCTHYYFSNVPSIKYLSSIIYSNPGMYNTDTGSTVERYGTMLNFIEWSLRAGDRILDFGSGAGVLANGIYN